MLGGIARRGQRALRGTHCVTKVAEIKVDRRTDTVHCLTLLEVSKAFDIYCSTDVLSHLSTQ